MGLFNLMLGGDGGRYMKTCPVCGLMAGSKPGGFTDFYGSQMFNDRVAYREAVSEYESLIADYPYDFVCWPAVVSRHVSMTAVRQYRQRWENNNPGDRSSVWQDLTAILEGRTLHNPVV